MRKVFRMLVGAGATICFFVAIFLFLAAIFSLSLTSLVFSIVYMMVGSGLGSLYSWLQDGA